MQSAGAREADGTPNGIGGLSNQVDAGMTSGGSESSAGSLSGGGGLPMDGMATAGAPAGPKVATMVSAGTTMSCAVVNDGSVWCWGTNQLGQLGNGSDEDSWVPVRVKGISTAVAISIGGTWRSGGRGASLSAFACAVLRNGAAVCWGGAFFDTVADRSTPRTIFGVNDAVSIACGEQHACALTRNGSVICWGANGSGQLGLGGSTTCPASNCPPSATVTGITSATAIAGQGSDYSCALLTDSSVWCWGADNGGTEFGSAINATVPVRASSISASAIGVGRSDSCVLAIDGGNVTCWGGTYGSSGPVTVQGLRAPAVAISEGAFTTCAVLNDATVQCWGEGRRGQLGNDSSVSSQSPVDVSGLRGAVAVSVGYLHACALTKTGSVSCWGANDGALGYGDPTARDSARPATVTGF